MQISGELLSLNGGRGRPPLQVSHTAFLREADLVAAQPIPGYMPRFFARGSFEGAPYFVMELAERLPDNLSARHVIALTDRLADALDRLWSAGLLHNDIKPQNLGLIGGQLVLLDFGSACKADEAAACRQRIGTPYYTAPEVNAGGHLSLVSNLYSLGMTLDELCTDEIRPVFTPLIRHATALNPADRPQTPAAFRAKLHRALPAYRKAAARTTRLDRFKTVAKWTAAVALGFVAIVWVIYAVQQQRVTRHGKSIIEQENNYIAALNFYRKGDFTNAVFLLRPIAEGDGSRKAQAQQLLKACLIPCSAESAAN